MIETNEIVPESDVLVAVTEYLVTRRKVLPYQFSLATGKGIDNSTLTEWLKQLFASVGQSPTFSGNGADIIACSSLEWWQIECKGAGSGKVQTQRNNFDRALASVVSYFEKEPPAILKEKFPTISPFLGLALPATGKYLSELKSRVRQPLREQLNLWILLYNPINREISVISPDEKDIAI